MKKLIVPMMMTAMLVSASSAFASIAAYTGVWKNVDNNTSGITKMIIRVSGSTVLVKTFGKCHPTDCNWGQTKALPFTINVSSSELRQTKALTAVYKQGFANKLLVIKKRGQRLVVQLFANMKDSRSNYTKNYVFKR